MSISCSKEVLERAKSYYFRHMDLNPVAHDYMWNQASEDYRWCWIRLAEIDLQDEEEEHNTTSEEK